MIDVDYLYEVFKSKINGYVKLVKSSNEIITRCPYCGDSIKHQNKGHFYIGTNGSGLFLYQCKRAECCATGILTKRVLEDLDIFDIELFAELTKHNLEHSDLKNSSFINKNILRESFDFNIIDNVPNLDKKLSYLNRRLFNFDKSELEKYRIILSIKNYSYFNKLKLNLSNEKITLLEEKAIGFRSLNGSCLIFRFIDDSTGYRYFKLKLNDDNDVYGIENKINLNDYPGLVVNISEGIFDIINIERRLKRNIQGNEIFLASNSADYVSKIEYIAKYSGLLNLDINIYRDTDAPIKKILHQFKNSIFKNNINIFSNTLGKDYSDNDIYLIKDF